MNVRLGILTTHPIQYQVPWFRALAKLAEINLTVFFCMIPDEVQQGDGFGVPFKWDIPLLEGYRYEVLENTASKPSISNFYGCDTPGIGEIVKNGGFDAFIVNGWVVKSCIQLLFACRKYNVPCIVRGESNALCLRAWWKRLFHRYLLGIYSAFLNIGESNKDFYLQNGVPDKKIFFAPYCVENERFTKEAGTLYSEREVIRSGWGIKPSSFTFLFCAKFIRKKRPMDLLKAMMLALQEMDNPGMSIHLLMVGEGELREECEHFALENHLPVTFTGFLNQSEITRVYVASDCIVLPSDYGETWGLVVNEAMACGLPAIVSNRVGCSRDIVRKGLTGEIFPFGDVKALSILLKSFASHPEKVKSMGEEAKKLIGNYSYDEVVKGTLAAVEYVKRVKGSC